MRRALAIPALLALALSAGSAVSSLSACKADAPGAPFASGSVREPEPPSLTAAALDPRRGERARPRLDGETETPPSCLTMRTVEDADILRVEGGIAFYARPDTGLSIFDVNQLTAPKLLSTSDFVGTPISVFVESSIAWVVFVARDEGGASASNRPGRSLVRALDVRAPDRPVVLGEAEVAGVARDARRVGGVVYVLSAEPAAAVAPANTVLSSFAVRGDALRRIDALTFSDGPGVLAMSPFAAAVLRSGGDATSSATRVDLATGGELTARATLKLPGALPTWDGAERVRADLDEGDTLVAVTCPRPGCSPSDGASLVVADLSDPVRPRMLSRTSLGDSGGSPIARFVGHVFLHTAAASASLRDGDPSTDVVASRFTAGGVPFETGRVTLRGASSAIVPRALDRAVVIGSAGPHRHAEIVVHDLSIGESGSLRASSSITVGRDWTWTLAHDTDHAMSFDPFRRLLAIPFTAFTNLDGRYVTGAQLVEIGARGIASTQALPSRQWIERLVFLGSRLVAFGPDGVEVLDYREGDATLRPEERSAAVR